MSIEKNSLRKSAEGRSGVAHVGAGKAASTFLQLHYFIKLNKDFYSTQKPYKWPRELGFVYESNYLWFDSLRSINMRGDRETCSANFASRITEKISKWKCAVSGLSEDLGSGSEFFLSAEGLSGMSAEVCALNMEMLKLAGVGKVLFICRRQASWAVSLWRQLVLVEDTFCKYLTFSTLFGVDDNNGIVDIDWNLYIQAMDAEFGSDNVLVLPYELLVDDSCDLFMRLNVFLGLAEDALIPDSGVRENPSRTDSMYQGLSLDGIFPFDRLPGLRSKLHLLAAKFPGLVPGFVKREYSMSISPQTLDALQRRMSSANKRLEARIGIDLKNYGYY